MFLSSAGGWVGVLTVGTSDIGLMKVAWVDVLWKVWIRQREVAILSR